VRLRALQTLGEQPAVELVPIGVFGDQALGAWRPVVAVREDSQIERERVEIGEGDVGRLGGQ